MLSALRRTFVLIAAVAALAAGTLGAPVAGTAQTLPGLSLPTVPPQGGGIRQEGIFTTAPISLDGATLFRIAMLTNGGPADQMPLALRQSYIEGALAQVLTSANEGDSTEYDPQTLKVIVRQQNGQSLLAVKDSKHADPFPLLTVTSADAQYQQLPTDQLAAQWRAILEPALVQALEKRQPAFQRASVKAVVIGAAVLALATLLIGLLIAALRRRIDALQELQAKREAQLHASGVQPVPADAGGHQQRRRFLALALLASDPAQRASLYSAIADSLLWILALAWLVGTTWALVRFPQTTTFGRALFAVAGIWIAAGLLNRLSDVVLTRVARAWRSATDASAEERARTSLRAPTIARAISGGKTVVLVFLAILATLTRIGVPVESVVTIGGVTAIAVSFAAQNLVRDFMTGFLVLLEDQYAVGDYVTINAQSGLVERLTLRIVQIRDAGGNFITIPHSAVTVVVNRSRDWSRVDYRVPVDPGADISKALELVRTAVEQMAADVTWRTAFLDPIDWIGIDQINRDAVVDSREHQDDAACVSSTCGASSTPACCERSAKRRSRSARR